MMSINNTVGGGNNAKNSVKLDLKSIKIMAYPWLAFEVKRPWFFNFQIFNRPLTGLQSLVLTGPCYFQS